MLKSESWEEYRAEFDGDWYHVCLDGELNTGDPSCSSLCVRCWATISAESVESWENLCTRSSSDGESGILRSGLQFGDASAANESCGDCGGEGREVWDGSAIDL